ncbi:hypothetical protein DY000_02040849 [Brassica cretica]|uniref:Uncharacterized protein n=1 Tax=Brassica cretica TaxID=69181 RepID=A0ABQ7BGQ0_BRACR|nr:hypothetical protein DY000_02040849 [Brassica cretica]
MGRREAHILWEILRARNRAVTVGMLSVSSSSPDVCRGRDRLRCGQFCLPRRSRETWEKQAIEDKEINLDDIDFPTDDFPLPGWGPDFTPGDRSGTRKVPLPNCDFENFFSSFPPNFDLPPAVDELSRSRVIAKRYQRAQLGSQRELSSDATLSFQGKEGEKQISRLHNKASARDGNLVEDHARALRRAERKGRREVAVVVGSRACQFEVEYKKLKEAQERVGDFRECRGSVGTFWKTQEDEYTFEVELKIMTDSSDHAHAESMEPPIEGRIRGLWDPIPVSSDTEEIMADFTGEGG